VSSVLTAIGISLLLFGTIAGLAIADAPAAVAVTAGIGVSGACMYACCHWRFRRGEPWFPALAKWRYRAADRRAENRVVRRGWSDEELAALDDQASLEQLLARTDAEARREGKFR
jgi:hypothetical protein